MINSDEIRELTVAQAAAADRPAYISAASGLVCVGSWMYVVADDEHHLGVFRSDSQAPGRLWRLMDGVLPSYTKDRKKQKPDFEVLLKLPAFDTYSTEALLVAGSGSRANRQMGVLVGLDSEGALLGTPKTVDLSFIFKALADEFEAVNIEGAVVLGSELLLFQRGNKKNGVNAAISFSLLSFLKALGATHPAKLKLLSSQIFDLGEIYGVPLSFTDAAALPDGEVVFSAVAEDTDDSYNGGRCMGSALGMIGADGRQRWLRKLSQPNKIEGLDVRRDGNDLKILMVTDADDIALPAKLLVSTTRFTLEQPTV